MVDPFQIATQGIGPGWTTFNMATMGFGFEVEVIIRPTTGGGGGGTAWSPAGPYEVIVRIKYKGKTWEQSKLVSPLFARSLEKVLASFKRMNVSVINIVATINNVIRQKISVFARSKQTKG